MEGKVYYNKIYLCRFILVSLEIYAMLLGRKGEEQRALAASAVSQLSSAQNNKYTKAVYLEVHALNLHEGNKLGTVMG